MNAITESTIRLEGFKTIPIQMQYLRVSMESTADGLNHVLGSQTSPFLILQRGFSRVVTEQQQPTWFRLVFLRHVMITIQPELFLIVYLNV